MKRRNHYDASVSPQIHISEKNLLLFDLRGESNRYEDAALSGLVNYRYAAALIGFQRQSTHLSIPISWLSASSTSLGTLRFAPS